MKVDDFKCRMCGACCRIKDGIVRVSDAEDNLCRINPVKPEKCRTFPFEWTNPDSDAVCPGLTKLER